jgi:co-chaperonin GroES (HSP10)
LHFDVDPLRIYLSHDGSLPDWKLASQSIRCLPGCVAVERLAAPEKQGSLYLPSRAKHTYYDDDDEPIAGFEPSVGIVLQTGAGVSVSPGQVVIIRDGDGLEFEHFKACGYIANSPVMMFGIIVPDGSDPGYVESLPWDESILGVVEGMQIREMTGKNVLLERDECDVSRKTESGLYLPDGSAENVSSEATVKMAGPLVTQCKPGDRVFYHPMGCLDFYNPENSRERVVREQAILAVKIPELATV